MKKHGFSLFWLVAVLIGVFAPQAGALVVSNDQIDDIRFCELSNNIVMTVAHRLPVNFESDNSWQKGSVPALDVNRDGSTRRNAVASTSESYSEGIAFNTEKIDRPRQANNLRQLYNLAQNEVPEVLQNGSGLGSFHTIPSSVYQATTKTLNKISENWEIKKSFQENYDNTHLNSIQGGFGPEIQLEKKLNETLSISIGGKRDWGDRDLQVVTGNKPRYDVSLGFRWSF